MDAVTTLFLIFAIPIIAFPAMLIWYTNLGGIWSRFKHKGI